MRVGIGLGYCYVHQHLLLSKLSLDLTLAHNLAHSNITEIELAANMILFGQI